MPPGRYYAYIIYTLQLYGITYSRTCIANYITANVIYVLSALLLGAESTRYTRCMSDVTGENTAFFWGG